VQICLRDLAKYFANEEVDVHVSILRPLIFCGQTNSAAVMQCFYQAHSLDSMKWLRDQNETYTSLASIFPDTIPGSLEL
jgi:hypothetical protein